MKDLWLINCYIDEEVTDYLPILAENKSDVGKYIKDNVGSDKLFTYFENLSLCGNSFGKVRQKLKKWYDKTDFFELMDDEGEKNKFIRCVKKVLNEMDDEEVVDEFWGYAKKSDGMIIRIRYFPNNRIIEL